MPMNPIRPGLRALHNGSNDVAKVSINVPAGDDLVVSEYVADQLKRQTGAFKDGAAPAKAEPALAGDADEDTEPAAPRAKKAAPRAKK